MSKLVVANWKMNQPDLAHWATLDFTGKNVVVCPPFPFIEEAKKKLKGVKLGAQDVFYKPDGAYTGEVSAEMLRNLGVEYVIVGHSERRKLGDTDEIINAKVKAVLAAKLKPILCIGEAYDVRERGMVTVKRYLREYLRADIESAEADKIIVAYEPLWAISTSPGARPDTPQDAAEAIAYIKEVLKTYHHVLHPKVLYGGSVTPQNAAGFLEREEIDGALVGGASLEPQDFINIVDVA